MVHGQYLSEVIVWHFDLESLFHYFNSTPPV